MDILTLDYLAALLFLSCRGFDSNHGCLPDHVEADLNGDLNFFHAWFQDHESEGALFDTFLDTVLIGVSEDTL